MTSAKAMLAIHGDSKRARAEREHIIRFMAMVELSDETPVTLGAYPLANQSVRNPPVKLNRDR